MDNIVNTSGEDNKTAKYTYDYDENWFFTPSTTYQHELTKMSIRAAMAGYGVLDAPHSVDTNIKYLMAGNDKNSLEFTNYESSYPDPKTNTIGYAIGSKNIKNSAGETCSLLMVTVRGGGYMDEWGGNFDLGTKDEHQGFNEAALQVRDGIKKYVEKYKDKLPYELKVWISGYSRGAATTNLVAKMLDDGAIEGLTRDNIYAFCFECPQNTTKTQSYVESDKYKNIVSIVNSVDLVPKVAMSGFGFKRYGTVYQLPNIRALADYGIARAKMVKCYTDLIAYNKLALGARMYDWTEKEMKNLYLPMQAVVYLTKEGLAQASMMDKLMDDLCDVAVNRENYYMRLQANMISGMAGVLGKNSGLDTGGKKVTITASNDKIKVSASWKVTSMKGIVKKVKITGAKTVKAGKSLKLKANVTATKKANKKLQWTSSNTKYATVNAKGVVKTKKTAKRKTIKITAMATDGSNKKATFKVKVK